MKTTIVYAHPYEGSFNRAVLTTVLKATKAAHVIDLYADGFDPVLREDDLALYPEGKSNDPLVADYNEILDDTEELIFIFPIWWYDMPAMLRGFLEKVMLEGSAYHTGSAGLSPIRDIKKTFLLTTSSTPTESLVEDFGDPMQDACINATLTIIGCHDIRWINFGGIDGSTEKERTEYLTKIRNILQEKKADTN